MRTTRTHRRCSGGIASERIRGSTGARTPGAWLSPWRDGSRWLRSCRSVPVCSPSKSVSVDRISRIPPRHTRELTFFSTQAKNREVAEPLSASGGERLLDLPVGRTLPGLGTGGFGRARPLAHVSHDVVQSQVIGRERTHRGGLPTVPPASAAPCSSPGSCPPFCPMDTRSGSPARAAYSHSVAVGNR